MFILLFMKKRLIKVRIEKQITIKCYLKYFLCSVGTEAIIISIQFLSTGLD